MIARPIGTYAELSAASGGHPFVRFEFTEGAPVRAVAHPRAQAVAVVRHSAKRGAVVSLIGRDVDAVAELLASPAVDELLFAEGRVGRISVPAPLLPALENRYRTGQGGDWEWMVTMLDPPSVAGEDRVVDLGPAFQRALTSFLARHNPRTDGEPFARPRQRWVGALEAGEVIACGCAEPNEAGILGLAGITVHPDRRGAGLGAAVTAALTRPGVAAAGAVTLGMYSDNAVARRIYHGLGYRTEISFASRVVTAR